MEIKTFVCKQSDIRLDHFLTDVFKISRNQIIDLIKRGHVSVEGKAVTKAGTKLNENQTLSVTLVKQKTEVAKEQNERKKVDFDIPIIYEDEDILVINKPPFLIVHPAPSTKNELTVVDWLKSKNFSLSTLSGDIRNGIVHRIDKETSGALVIAKNNRAHAFLSKQLEDKSMGRYYVALINHGLKNTVLVEKKIARNNKNRLKMAVMEDGKDATTAFATLLENDQINLIAAKLFTGRTHQIRVHLQSIGRYVLGDDLYGFKSQKDKIKRVMLHAYTLFLIHPTSGKKLLLQAPLYDDFRNILEQNFTKEQIDEALDQANIISSFNSIN